MKGTRPVVLVAIDWYLPAYRAGGPIRSIANLVAALGDEIDFRIVCGNRDLGESEDLPVKANTWTTFGKSQVQYLPHKRLDGRQVERTYSRKFSPTVSTSTACIAGLSADFLGRWPGKWVSPQRSLHGACSVPEPCPSNRCENALGCSFSNSPVLTKTSPGTPAQSKKRRKSNGGSPERTSESP